MELELEPERMVEVVVELELEQQFVRELLMRLPEQELVLQEQELVQELVLLQLVGL